MNPWQVVDDFEAALRGYTGAPYVVCVSSATAALFLSMLWCRNVAGINWCGEVYVPRRTYISVPQQVRHAYYKVEWSNEEWRGVYQLRPLPVWDCALRFTSGMYVAGQFQCVSFAAAKILGMEQGGAILHDNRDADRWLRKMRYDGRTPGKEVADDEIDVCGYHFPMIPSVAAQGILRLSQLPKHNADQMREYPDVSQKACFR